MSKIETVGEIPKVSEPQPLGNANKDREFSDLIQSSTKQKIKLSQVVAAIRRSI